MELQERIQTGLLYNGLPGRTKWELKKRETAPSCSYEGNENSGFTLRFSGHGEAGEWMCECRV